LFGAAYLFQVFYSYPSADFPEHSVSSLLKYIKVSAVRPIPSTIRGRIIGKGVPGLIYSEDLVMQDNTGYIFLNYAQPLNIFNFLFGLKNTAYIGTDVVVTGWYRRAPVPYFEIYKMQAYDGVSTCYIYWYKIITAIFFIGLGIFLMASM
jgi:heat shock protein HtpX